MIDGLPGFADVKAASERLRGIAVRTPLIEAAALGERLGRRVFLKLETLQRGGAFKFRGAYNRLVQLDAAQRARGIVAWSSGNHAQGVAWAGRLLGIPVAVVMPADAPPIKIARTLALGAEVIRYDRASESREAIARRLTMERGATLVPSYDDPDIIAGQGTVGLEIAEQAEALGLVFADCLVPCGGGGLIAGCVLALGGTSPATRCFAVEPEGYDDTARSLSMGSPQQVMEGARSICDALLAPTPGALTFAINRTRIAGGIVVTDDEVRQAIAYAATELKLVVEPGGAVALAALLAGLAPVGNDPVVAILSGANIEPALLADIIRTGG